MANDRPARFEPKDARASGPNSCEGCRPPSSPLRALLRTPGGGARFTIRDHVLSMVMITSLSSGDTDLGGGEDIKIS